jgi:hypothetical protein
LSRRRSGPASTTASTPPLARTGPGSLASMTSPDTTPAGCPRCRSGRRLSPGNRSAPISGGWPSPAACGQLPAQLYRRAAGLPAQHQAGTARRAVRPLRRCPRPHHHRPDQAAAPAASRARDPVRGQARPPACQSAEAEPGGPSARWLITSMRSRRLLATV